MQAKNRIDTLDSFRAIAVIMVVLFHFYARWPPPFAESNLYPYGNSMSAFFNYGYFGVDFFFVISGFVIFYTLEKSENIADFLLKRFIRLFPPMLLCSIITYFFIRGVNHDNQLNILESRSPLNFLPSLTFTLPVFWRKFLHRPDITFINGSYWSLWVEVTFYISSSIVFFLNKEKFVQRWMFLLVPVTLLRLLAKPQFYLLFPHAPATQKVLKLIRLVPVYFNLCNFFVYFSLGIFFYCLYFKKKVPPLAKYICFFFTVAEFFILPETGLRIFFLLIIVLFLLFVYRHDMVAFLNNRMLTRVGVISYSVYLIHENIGIMLIHLLGGVISSPVVIRLIPVALMVFLIAFAELMYRFYEKPVTNYLRRILLKK